VSCLFKDQGLTCPQSVARGPSEIVRMTALCTRVRSRSYLSTSHGRLDDIRDVERMNNNRTQPSITSILSEEFLSVPSTPKASQSSPSTPFDGSICPRGCHPKDETPPKESERTRPLWSPRLRGDRVLSHFKISFGCCLWAFKLSVKTAIIRRRQRYCARQNLKKP
jgi:hypothetical protein